MEIFTSELSAALEEENTHITVVDRITSHCLHYLGMGGGGGGTRGGGSGGRGRLAEVEDTEWTAGAPPGCAPGVKPPVWPPCVWPRLCSAW